MQKTFRGASSRMLTAVAWAVAVSAAGCGVSEYADSADAVSMGHELTSRHHHPPAVDAGTPTAPPDAGSSSGAGACDVCVQATACCSAVNRTCGLDATYCAGLDPVRQHAYVVDCKVYLNLIRSVWQPNLPAACL
jgi:hypothetical protein